MNDTTARDALQRSISARLPLLSHDELRVFDVQLERMLKVGRDNHGPLDLANEHRDWRKEASDEFSDALFYMCAQAVARQDRRRERLECFKHDQAYESVAPGLHELVANTTGDECEHCSAPEGAWHRHGCQWSTVVPAGAV